VVIGPLSANNDDYDDAPEKVDPVQEKDADQYAFRSRNPHQPLPFLSVNHPDHCIIQVQMVRYKLSIELSSLGSSTGSDGLPVVSAVGPAPSD
jgi:hypothetical protein